MRKLLTVGYRLAGVSLVLIAGSVAADMSSAIERVNDSVFMVKLEQGVGSGFVVAASGEALTCAHVVGEAGEVLVTLADGTELSAEVVARDEERDLALLRLERRGLPAVVFAGAEELKRGTPVAVVGAPFGLENSVTQGVISAVAREVEGRQYLQIDAALNEGNSGGPVINDRGEVVGVAASVVREADNVGFALPSEAVLEFLEEQGVVVSTALGTVMPEPRPTEIVPHPAPPRQIEEPFEAAPWGDWRVLVLAFLISLAVSLAVSLLAMRSLRRSAAQAAWGGAAAPAARTEDLSDIDIELH